MFEAPGGVVVVGEWMKKSGGSGGGGERERELELELENFILQGL